jgi:hypothetical protein
MLKLLSKLLGKRLDQAMEPLVPEQEILDSLYPPDSSEMIEAKAAVARKKEHLGTFIRQITSHLKPSETQRFVRVANHYLDEALACYDLTPSTFEALATAIIGGEDSDGQTRGQWVLIHIGGNDADEIAWQVGEVLGLYGLEAEWDYAGNPDDDCDVRHALGSLAKWLETLGFGLIEFGTENTDYCCLIVKNADRSVVKSLAAAAELAIYDQTELGGLRG